MNEKQNHDNKKNRYFKLIVVLIDFFLDGPGRLIETFWKISDQVV